MSLIENLLEFVIMFEIFVFVDILFYVLLISFDIGMVSRLKRLILKWVVISFVYLDIIVRVMVDIIIVIIFVSVFRCLICIYFKVILYIVYVILF